MSLTSLSNMVTLGMEGICVFVRLVYQWECPMFMLFCFVISMIKIYNITRCELKRRNDKANVLWKQNKTKLI